MTVKDIIAQRLSNQLLIHSDLKKPAQVLEYMGAMQAQEYAMAKWAIGLRLPGSTDADIEKAFNEGKILRTHLLRPTWHFVSPKDIRWMLELSAPRVNQANAFMYKKLGMNEALMKRASSIFAKTLKGSKYMTRQELNQVLAKNKIAVEGHHLSYILMHAELEGILCSGPREGNQFTYALLDERVPPKKKIEREEALAKLSEIYFKSRGPATVQDFSTWGNLTLKDAREGMKLIEKKLFKENMEGKDYFFADLPSKNKSTLHSFLMPDYDEYGMSYKDRSAIFDPAKHKASVSRGNPVFNRMIILDGRIEGTWQKNLKKGKAGVQTFPFSKLNSAKQKSLEKAVNAYLIFKGSSSE